MSQIDHKILRQSQLTLYLSHQHKYDAAVSCQLVGKGHRIWNGNTLDMTSFMRRRTIWITIWRWTKFWIATNIQSHLTNFHYNIVPNIFIKINFTSPLAKFMSKLQQITIHRSCTSIIYHWLSRSLAWAHAEHLQN